MSELLSLIFFIFSASDVATRITNFQSSREITCNAFFYLRDKRASILHKNKSALLECGLRVRARLAPGAQRARMSACRILFP